MIDLLLSMVAVLLIAFGFWLCFISSVKMDAFQLVQGAIIMILGFALYFHASHTSTTEHFNPATDDCTKWEDCPSYAGEKGILDVTSQSYAMCDYPRHHLSIAKSLTGKSKSPYAVAGHILKESCVSWQPKKVAEMQCWRDENGRLYAETNVNSCSSRNGFICAWKIVSESCLPNSGCVGKAEFINIMRTTCIEKVPR